MCDKIIVISKLFIPESDPWTPIPEMSVFPPGLNEGISPNLSSIPTINFRTFYDSPKKEAQFGGW